jgi:hypothetical protein
MKRRAGYVAAGAAATIAVEVIAYVWALRRVAMERLG